MKTLKVSIQDENTLVLQEDGSRGDLIDLKSLHETDIDKSSIVNIVNAIERGEFEKEKGALTGKLTALESRVLGESKKAVLGGFTGDFIAPESVDLVAQLVKTELDGDQVKTQFTDFAGNVITTDPAEFKKWMAKHPAISHLMKADAASGGGAAGGKGSGSGAAPKFSALKDLPVR